MSIKKIYNIMHQLENESGKLAKEKILKDYEGDTEFREALVFLLNPYIVTGISTKKMSKEVESQDAIAFPITFDALMDYLKLNKSGRDKDILAIQAYISTLESDELKKFVKKFVTKDLKLGISAKTVNKVYGKGTIPSHDVMLAESYAKKEAIISGDFYITLKLDGNRCTALKENGEVKFFTRKGQPILDMVDLTEHFKPLPDGWAFDGELLLDNKDNLPSDKLFRATQKVVRKDGVKKDLEFHMFDMLPVDEFKAGKSKSTYRQRRNQLDLLDKIVEESHLIHILPVLYVGNDKEKIAVLMKWAENNDFEGLMVNTADGLYVNKRTNDLLKVKKMKTADLLVMTVEKAIDGQFEGLLSRVNVEYKGNMVGVGSGFTLEERRMYAENPDLICGKIIEVAFFEESQDEKTEQLSLRFPVFKGIRHDKDVEDINYGE